MNSVEDACVPCSVECLFDVERCDQCAFAIVECDKNGLNHVMYVFCGAFARSKGCLVVEEDAVGCTVCE